MRIRFLERPLEAVLLVATSLLVNGCAVVAVTGTAVSIATTTVGVGVSVGSAVVGTGVSAVKAVTP